jgi:putative flippase GtrA
MTLIPPRISEALWRIVPAPLRSRLRSTVVRRFVRFAPAAVCAVAASQITYIICLGPANLTAGLAGFLGWLAGAAVSYVISRWAWERKGRPHLIKETLPFVLVSVGAGVVLTLASKFGNHVAVSMGLTGAARVLVADGFYFAANCLTFALRFLIFHYVLFADRKTTVDALAVVEGRQPAVAEPAGPSEAGSSPAGLPQAELSQAGPLSPAGPPAAGARPPRADGPSQPAVADPADTARFAEAMRSARVNGRPVWANGATGPAHSRPAGPDETVFPESGTRR